MRLRGRPDRSEGVPGAWLLALLVTLSGTVRAQQVNDALCAMCHSDVRTPSIALRSGDVPPDVVHGGVGCLDCHRELEASFDLEEMEHAVPARAVACDECHEDTAKALAGGGHSRAGVDCARCHGGHEIRRFHPADRALRDARVNQLCLGCHMEVLDAEPGTPHAVAMRGRTCLACHDAHRVHAPEPLVGDENCLTCHEDAEPENGAAPPSVVPSSVHGSAGIRCVLCHQGLKDAEELPHSDPGEVRCGACHEGEATALAHSVHDLSDGRGARCVDCHGGHDVLPPEDPRSRVFPRNLPSTCEACHLPGEDGRGRGRGSAQVGQYEESIHGRLLREQGLVVAATCANCHGSHEVRAAEDPEATTGRRRVPYTCGGCHAGSLDAYLEGVHGKDFLEGSLDVPVCTDCHSEHGIQDFALARSSGAADVVAATCARCHAKDELGRVYGFDPSRARSWGRSYHGLALSFGAGTSADCASCHGHHAILPSSDPRSQVHPNRLNETCGSCHPGAGVAFTRVPVHSIVDRETNPVPWWVRRIYTWVIVAVIGAFLFFIAVDLFGRIRIRLGLGPPETRFIDPAEWPDEDELFPPSEKIARMSLRGRIGHALLIVAFLLLVLTGLPLFLHDLPWIRNWIDLQGGFLVRSRLHRVGAIALIVLSVGHVALLCLSRRARRWAIEMFPRPADVIEFVQDAMFNLGILTWLGRQAMFRGVVRRFPGLCCDRRPARGRYGLVEKLEYMAVVWGNGVMVASGLVLWRPDWFLSWMPAWSYDVCRVVHGYEATLAFLAIIVWHMYHVHLRPGIFPMSRIWLDGKVGREELRQHHPAEYLRILRERRQKEAFRQED